MSLGESWHNNHHSSPGAENFGLNLLQIDIGYSGGVVDWLLLADDLSIKISAAYIQGSSR
jgi:fatty-acid desaturase